MQEKERRLIVGLRRELHRAAELSGKEYRTKKILMDFLRWMTHLEIVDRGAWFYAYYEPEMLTSKAPIAFRADFDALPIPETIDLPYSSQTPGVSHKCGHDGHSAALAGLALVLERNGADRPVYLIFQHAEEIGGGGEACAKLLREKQISEIYAFHNWSGFPERAVLVRPGTVQCASKGLTIHFMGKTAHASQPENGINPSKAVAKLLLAVEKSSVNPRYRGLVLTTLIHVEIGEKNFGIAASTAEASFTLRAEYEKELDALELEIRETAKRLAEEEHLKVSFEEQDVFPETANDPGCTERIIQAAERVGIPLYPMEKPFRASEDFGWYQKECPGAMLYIGNGENYPPIHTTEYDFNDRILEVAVKVFWELIKSSAISSMPCMRNGRNGEVDFRERN